MKQDETQPVLTSVRVGNLEMTITEDSLKKLCDLKRHSGVYSRAIDRIMRKLIDVGVCDEADDKSDYIFLLRDLQDIKDHYDQIAGLQLMMDGEEVLQVE